MKNYNDPATQDPKRENKRTRRFIFLTAGVILLSCLILAVCIFGIASRLGEEEEHTPEGSPEYTDETLASQQELREKFGVYTHVSENGKNVTLFSEEQIASIEKAKADGTLPRLGYDEVMFLINDSVDLYLKHDGITLTGQDKTRVIESEHRELSSSLGESEAKQLYTKMTSDVLKIILHRISTLDAGLLEVSVVTTPYSGIHGYHAELFLEDEKIKMSSMSFLSGYYAMAIGERDIKSDDTYRNPLKKALALSHPTYFKSDSIRDIVRTDTDDSVTPTSLPLLIISELSIVVNEDGKSTKCFPTQSWDDMFPDTELPISYSNFGICDFVKERYLDVEYISFELANSKSTKKSQELFTIRDEETINRLMSHLSTDIFNISLNDTITPDQPFDYYKLTLSTGILIRIPCDEAYGAIASTSTPEYYTHCISEEFAQAVRDIGENARAYKKHELRFSQLPPRNVSDQGKIARIREFDSLYKEFRVSVYYDVYTKYVNNYNVLYSHYVEDLINNKVNNEDACENYMALLRYVEANPDTEYYLINNLMIHDPYCIFNEYLFHILLSSNEKLSDYCRENGIIDKAEVLKLLSERYDEFLVQ